QHASRQARGRSGRPAPSGGLAELPYTLYHAGSVSGRAPAGKSIMRQSPLARATLILFFAGLLAILGVRKWTASRNNATSAGEAHAASSHYAIALHEAARASGIDFVHQAPKLDSRLDPIM